MEAVYEGCTYKEIQLKCGCPSKSFIKDTIKENNPELYDIITDTKKIKTYRKKQFNNTLNKNSND